LLINFFDSLPDHIKEGIATRACSADGCFSWEAIFVAGLVFGKGVCAFISGSSDIEILLYNIQIRKTWD